MKNLLPLLFLLLLYSCSNSYIRLTKQMHRESLKVARLGMKGIRQANHMQLDKAKVTMDKCRKHNEKVQALVKQLESKLNDQTDN